MKQSILLTAVLLFISADVFGYTICAPMSAGIGSCGHSTSSIDVFGKRNVVTQTIDVSEDVCRQMMRERITCRCVEVEKRSGVMGPLHWRSTVAVSEFRECAPNSAPQKQNDAIIYDLDCHPRNYGIFKIQPAKYCHR